MPPSEDMNLSRAFADPGHLEWLLTVGRRVQDQIEDSFRALDLKARTLLGIDAGLLAIVLGLSGTTFVLRPEQAAAAPGLWLLLPSLVPLLAALPLLLQAYAPRSTYLDVAPHGLREIVELQMDDVASRLNVLISTVDSAERSYASLRKKAAVVVWAGRAVWAGAVLLAILMLALVFASLMGVGTA